MPGPEGGPTGSQPEPGPRRIPIQWDGRNKPVRNVEVSIAPTITGKPEIPGERSLELWHKDKTDREITLLAACGCAPCVHRAERGILGRLHERAGFTAVPKLLIDGIFGAYAREVAQQRIINAEVVLFRRQLNEWPTLSEPRNTLR